MVLNAGVRAAQLAACHFLAHGGQGIFNRQGFVAAPGCPSLFVFRSRLGTQFGFSWTGERWDLETGAALSDTRNVLLVEIDSAALSCHVGWQGRYADRKTSTIGQVMSSTQNTGAPASKNDDCRPPLQGERRHCSDLRHPKPVLG